MTDPPQTDTRPGQAATPPGSKTTLPGPGVPPAGSIPPVELSPSPLPWVTNGRFIVDANGEDVALLHRGQDATAKKEFRNAILIAESVNGRQALETVVRAAQALIDYEETGAPDFLDWEPLFDALKTALSSPAVRAVLDAGKPGGPR